MIGNLPPDDPEITDLLEKYLKDKDFDQLLEKPLKPGIKLLMAHSFK